MYQVSVSRFRRRKNTRVLISSSFAGRKVLCPFSSGEKRKSPVSPERGGKRPTTLEARTQERGFFVQIICLSCLSCLVFLNQDQFSPLLASPQSRKSAALSALAGKPRSPKEGKATYRASLPRAPKAHRMYEAVAQAFLFFCVCLSVVIVTEKRQLFVPTT